MPTISVHVDDDVFAQVTALAEQWDRSKSWVVSDALEPYLEHRQWMLERTRETLKGVREGRIATVPHEQAVAQIRETANRRDAERKPR
jgi:predicted transcriptional regulator